MSSTVAIPTLDRPDHLLQTVEDLFAQDNQRFSILIVDQSDQVNASLIEKLHDSVPVAVSYYHVSFLGLPIARNFAWQHSPNEQIIFIDDDVRIPHDFVDRHESALAQDGVGVVAGGIREVNRPEHDDRHVGKFVKWTATPYRGYNRKSPCFVDHAPGGNFSTTRSVLEAVGGFDETFALGAALYEETDFCLRVREKTGQSIFFEPKAHLDHLAAPMGGCRVFDLKKYIWSLSRNRSILFKRHLSPIHLPTAYLYWLKLVASYGIKNRNPRVLEEAVKGWFDGTFRVTKEPVLSDRKPEILGHWTSRS